MKSQRYRDTDPLKKGELVVMHTCVEARNPKYEGRIWTCRTDQFTRGQGALAQDSVFLEDFSGSFAPEYLQRVNLDALLGQICVMKDALESICSNSEDDWAIDCAARALAGVELVGKLKAGDNVQQKLTGLEGTLIDIQYAHNRYQLKGISGWMYGISDLEALNDGDSNA